MTTNVPSPKNEDLDLETAPTVVYCRPSKTTAQRPTQRTAVPGRLRGRTQVEAVRPVAAQQFARLTIIGRYLSHELSQIRYALEAGRPFEFGSSTSELRDPYLDPKQAKIVPGRLGFSVDDLGSKNGVFVMVQAEVALRDGDSFRIGKQLVVYRRSSTFRTSERPKISLSAYWAHLEIMRSTETIHAVRPISGSEYVLGRRQGQLKFAEDGYMSAAHCRLRHRDGAASLEDLESSNGTYRRIRGRTVLPYGSVLLLGETLLRVDAC